MWKILCWVVGLCAIATASHADDQADGWPSRPVSIIVPFAPGSTPDLSTRIIAERLAARFHQPFVVENKPGASGNLGTNSVAHAAPDGYTVGVSIVGPLALNAFLFEKLPYDPKADLALVSVLVTQPSVLVVTPGLGIKSPAELIKALKSETRTFNYGSIGNGSLSHLAMEAIASKSGTRPTHIPYAGSPAVLHDLMRGDVQMAVMPAGSVVSLANAGNLTLLAVTSAHRSQLLPDLPTLGETGIAGVDAEAWTGLIAPAKTPPALLAKLRDGLRDVLAEPAVVGLLKAQYMEPAAGTEAEFRARLESELERWVPIIKANSIKIAP